MTCKLTYTGSPFSREGKAGDSTFEAPPENSLASQIFLFIADSYLLAINASSITLASFQILVNQGFVKVFKRVNIVGSSGDIPVSITYISANR